MEEKMLVVKFLLSQAMAEKKYLEEYKIASELNDKERKEKVASWIPMPKEFDRSPNKTYIKDRMKMIRQLCLEIGKECN